ncbi:MAG: hypothetical protein ABWY20_04965 [Mycobacterium sp.]
MQFSLKIDWKTTAARQRRRTPAYPDAVVAQHLSATIPRMDAVVGSWNGAPSAWPRRHRRSHLLDYLTNFE